VPGIPTPIDGWRRWADNEKRGRTSSDHLQPDDPPNDVSASSYHFSSGVCQVTPPRDMYQAKALDGGGFN
jgi:hypothetical protein